MATSKAFTSRANWVARIAVLAVFLINVSCALGFLIDPVGSAISYGIEGAQGPVAMQGMAVTFLMWNTTYPLVIFNPGKNIKVYIIVLAQQLVGLIGESLILATMDAAVRNDALMGSVLKFIAFDGGGLIIMGAAFIYLLRSKPKPTE
jgi:hypothetical protein